MSEPQIPSKLVIRAKLDRQHIAYACGPIAPGWPEPVEVLVFEAGRWSKKSVDPTRLSAVRIVPLAPAQRPYDEADLLDLAGIPIPGRMTLAIKLGLAVVA